MITPDILRSVPLLAELDEGDLQAIAFVAADSHLLAGEWLIQEGQFPAFFILLSGDVEITKMIGGVEQVLDHYHAGDYFGEVPLLLGSTAIASLRALSDIRVARLDATDFQYLLRKSETLSNGILQTMMRRVGNLKRLSVEAPVAQTLIVGPSAHAACYDLRQFLSRNRIGFRWLDPAGPKAAYIPAEVREGPYPAIVLTNGDVLRDPSRRDLAERLGLQTAPRSAVYDVAIIGGGPAGLAAAVYGASEGLRTLMVDREAPGGQAGTSSRIENYLGFPAGLSGDELGARALNQATRFGAEIVVTRTVTALRIASAMPQVVFDGGDTIEARTVILATGVSWRSLAVPGAETLVGRGIYYGAARTEARGVRDKNVYLIGGGNSAGQAAMFFADYARCVTLLIRSSSIEKGMSQYLIQQLRTKDNVRVALNACVTAVEGQSHLEAITVQHENEDGTDATVERLETDSLFVFIGADAETDWLPDTIARDQRGYLLTGIDVQAAGHWPLERDPYLLETSIPGIFAAGDVRHGSIKRVASGVGEGSMAIAFIHQYLALAGNGRPDARAAA